MPSIPSSILDRARAVRHAFYLTRGWLLPSKRGRRQIRLLLRLGRGNGYALLVSGLIVALTVGVDAILGDAVLGTRTGDLSQASIGIFGAVIGFIGVSTLVAAISISLLQAATEPYRSYIIDELVEDPERDALLRLIFVAFVVSLSNLCLAAAGVIHAGSSVAVPVLLTVPIFAFLIGYIRSRIDLFKPARIADHIADRARDLRPDALTGAPPEGRSTAGITLAQKGSVLVLAQLVSLSCEGLLPGEQARMDDSIAAYGCFQRLAIEHAGARLRRPDAMLVSTYGPIWRKPDEIRTKRNASLRDAVLARGDRREGHGRARMAGDDAALWFERAALQMAPIPLLVAHHKKGADDDNVEFIDAWVGSLGDWFETVRSGDIAMGMMVLDMVEAALPVSPAVARAAFKPLVDNAWAMAKPEAAAGLVRDGVEQAYLDAFIERASAVLRKAVDGLDDEFRTDLRSRLKRASNLRSLATTSAPFGWLNGPADA